MGKEQEQDLVSAYLQEWANKQSDVCSYINYSREEDFKRLWIDTKLDGYERVSPQRFLIDWNGFPFQNPAFPKIVEFITPLDWALAVAYQLVEKNSSGAGLPQVVIVDRCSYRYPGSFAVEMRRALAEALDGSVELYSAFGWDSEDLIALFDRLRSNPERRPATPRQGQLRALRQAWIGYTVQSRDHHDINNLIGPLALAGENGAGVQANADQSEWALFCMTRWLDLVEFEAGIGKGGWALGTRLAQLATKDEPIAAILIDDQAKRWASFLRSAFSGGNIRVSEITEPLKVLECMSSELTKQRPFERCLTLDNGKHKRDQILFLDLRFFPDGSIREREFILAVCDKILSFDFECKWFDDPHFRNEPLSERDELLLSAEEFKQARSIDGDPKVRFPFVSAAQRILASDQISWATIAKSHLYDELLTLFPRFLAQVLYTTPIVLFSSTGRRDLTERFKDYGNIITAFEKPRLPVLYDHVARSFSKAVDEAAQLIQARRQLRYFAATHVGSELAPPEGSHYHVELFIDEFLPHSSSSVWVGGFYIIFQGVDQVDALRQAAEFDDTLVSSGFSYYTRPMYGPQLPHGAFVKGKKEAAGDKLNHALTTSNHFKRGLVRLKCDAAEVGRASNSGDDVYRRSLSTIVESFVHEVMVQYFGARRTNVSFSVFAGTRSFGAKGTSAEAKAREAAYRWGLYTRRSEENQDLLLESLNRNTLYQILDGISEFRVNAWRMERAVGVQMIYEFKTKGPVSFSKAHLVCRKCRISVSTNMQVCNISSMPPDGQCAAVVTKLIPGRALVLLTDSGKSKRQFEARKQREVLLHKELLATSPSIKLGDQLDLLLIWNDKVGRDGLVVGYIATEIKFNHGRQMLDWSNASLCPSCHTDTDLRPDYPGGLYIADEIVDKDFTTSSYAGIVGPGPLDFDDTIDESLRSLIGAGRAADGNEMVRAALNASSAWIAAGGDMSTPLKRKILMRLTPEFEAMTGPELSAYASSLSMLNGFSEINEKLKCVVATAQMLTSTAPAGNGVDSQMNLGGMLPPNVQSDVPSGRCVILPGFARDMPVDQIEQVVKGAIEAQGLSDELMAIEVGWNGARSAQKCSIYCLDNLFEWTQETKRRAKETGLPWNDAIPQ